MSLSDWASPFESSQTSLNKPKNKTIKNNVARKIDKEKISQLLSKSNNADSDSDSESEMADFKPPPKPELTKGLEQTSENTSVHEDSPDQNIPLPVYTPQFNENEILNQYKKKTNQNLNNVFSQFGESDDINSKLNYLIKLIEEEKDEKTQNITEELILYCFLGVFVIFIVDSFVKVGNKKYTR